MKYEKPTSNNPHKIAELLKKILRTLDIGGEQSRQFSEEIAMLKETLKTVQPVKDNCPKCDAGSKDREFINSDLLGIKAIHMHYICGKCGSEIIEEFTLTEVFIDDPSV